MYILIKDTIPVGHAVNCAAHSALIAHLEWGEAKWHGDDKCFIRDVEYDDWIDNSFKKVTCKVTPEQFEQAKTMGFTYLICTEDKLNNEEVALIVHPKHAGHKWLNYLKLYK